MGMLPFVGTAPSVKVELLGAVRAWSDNGEIPLGPPRQRAVFAMLAASVGKVVSRSELIDGIWGEDPPASAEGSLYTYISDLRRALEPGRANRNPQPTARPPRAPATCCGSTSAGPDRF